MIWNKEMECADRSTMRVLQLKKLKATVKHVYDNVEHYRKKMDEAGVKPEDIQSLDDITKLPFVTKEDIAENYPTGLFAVPMKDIVRVHASSGTTGKPKIVGYTRNDLDMWGECVARGLTMAGADQDSVVHVSYGYGLFTGGMGAHLGAETVGATVIPMSSGNTQKQVTFMHDMKSNILCCTRWCFNITMVHHSTYHIRVKCRWVCSHSHRCNYIAWTYGITTNSVFLKS